MRSDCWSVGALLAVLLTGEVPFARASERNGFDDLPAITRRVCAVRSREAQIHIVIMLALLQSHAHATRIPSVASAASGQTLEGCVVVTHGQPCLTAGAVGEF